MTHTKGPWRVVYYDCGDRDHYDHNGPCPSIQAPDDEDCAIVHWDGFKQKYWSSANGNQKQIEANARLIAAAPSLLEALEGLVNFHNATDQGNVFQQMAEVGRLYDAAAAAIALARGEAGK